MPDSIFDLKYFRTEDEAQSVLDSMPFGDPPLIHLPSYEDIARVRNELFRKFERGQLTEGDILFAYQSLALSATSSDIVCGVVTGVHRCGGLMDIEVSVFGAYYQCRRTSTHRFPV